MVISDDFDIPQPTLFDHFLMSVKIITSYNSMITIACFLSYYIYQNVASKSALYKYMVGSFVCLSVMLEILLDFNEINH